MDPEPKEKRIRISEIFYSLQGEGLRSGRATIFIRFYGCNLSCSFCDTKYALEGYPGGYLSLSPEEVVEQIVEYPGKEVCITGGEPFHQPKGLYALCNILKERDYYIQVETNGSLSYPPGIAIDHVTFSPKTFVDCHYYVLSKEVKVVVSTKAAVEAYKELLDTYRYTGPRFLQPDSTVEGSTAICVAAVLDDPTWRLSLQLHSIIGVR